ncbi:MAG: DNA-binding protein WhiA [Bacilli bacterium]
MSFSTNIKDEVTKLEVTNSELLAELSAFFRNNAVYTEDHIELITENPSVAKRIFVEIKNLYQVIVQITRKKNSNFAKNHLYFLTINEKVKMILEDLAIINERGFYLLEPSEYLVETLEDQRAYLRGLFLAKGSVNDPKTSRYHLEFLIDTIEEAEFNQELLTNFDLNSKILNREKGYMLYIKEAEKISDFLRIINANNAVLYFEDIRIYRDHMNMTNRLNNCEQANMDKAVETATKQIADIQIITKDIGLEFLDDKTKEVINYRLKYPDSSLQELSEIITLETGKPITKSGLNHRFRKIKELASKIEEKG